MQRERVGGTQSILNGIKDILKGAILIILMLIVVRVAAPLVGPYGAIVVYVALFFMVIGAILAIIGIARIIYGLITL